MASCYCTAETRYELTWPVIPGSMACANWFLVDPKFLESQGLEYYDAVVQNKDGGANRGKPFQQLLKTLTPMRFR